MYLILLFGEANEITVKDFIPVGLAIAVFLGNAIIQRKIKLNDIRDKISSEVICTCDKMIRYATEAEYSALTLRYWNTILTLHPLTIKGNEEDNRNSINESIYYHRKTEDAGLKLDLLKSELKKSIKELHKYWRNKQEASDIIKIMSTAVLKEPRRFEIELNKKYNSKVEIDTDYNSLIDKVQYEVMFEGMGFDLVNIQKIIDPHSPTLHLSIESEKELLDKIKTTSKIQNTTSVSKLLMVLVALMTLGSFFGYSVCVADNELFNFDISTLIPIVNNSIFRPL